MQVHSKGESGAALGRDIQAKIGQQLRAIYDGVVGEGVPARFTDLLRRLDETTGARPHELQDEKAPNREP